VRYARISCGEIFMWKLLNIGHSFSQLCHKFAFFVFVHSADKSHAVAGLLKSKQNSQQNVTSQPNVYRLLRT